MAFIDDMMMAYAAADIVISRAGALSVSELCIQQKSTVLVPSPNVAEDHQTKNAMALVENDAAVMIEDKSFSDSFLGVVQDLISCLLYTSPSPRDRTRSRMPSSA